MYTTVYPRHVKLDNAFNFRDLGGYQSNDGRTVRWRMLFRSDALHYLTWSEARVVAEELGVRTVVDLRTPGAIEKEGLGPIYRFDVAHHHFPLLDDRVAERWQARRTPGRNGELDHRQALVDTYRWMLTQSSGQIKAVIELLARSDIYPAVFHCFAGKDRTGVLAAVVLGMLNVPDDVIIADYVETQRHIAKIVDRMRATDSYGALVKAMPPEVFKAEPHVMHALLDYVRSTYGSMREYAWIIGVAPATVVHLERNLLD